MSGVGRAFQAEDGIRDGRVTGVQTCALPIYTDAFNARHDALNSTGVNSLYDLWTPGRGNDGTDWHKMAVTSEGNIQTRIGQIRDAFNKMRADRKSVV